MGELTGPRPRTGMRRHWRYGHPGSDGALRVGHVDGGGLVACGSP